MSKLRSFIEELPKCELHVHIEGTLEPKMKLQLAKRNKVELPYKNEKAVRDAYEFDDLSSFLTVYYEGMSVLLTEQDLFDLTYAYLKKHIPRTYFTQKCFSIRRLTLPAESVLIL